ncbi:uncharacterized protein [Panulirus ornatus]|uniref:uncharacterized protein isoform X1 n=1 Tax=Panulirus ornatus TaxID=150431 RepID=UPI003A8B084A
MAENTTQSLYLKQIMLTMYSPLVKGGLGLFNLDLPPPPPADWLPGELARFSSLHLQAHHAEPMGADSNFLRQAIDQMCTNRSPTFNHELLNIYLDHSTIRKAKWCGFCRNNGEMPQIYCSHSLRDSSGRLTCAALRSYTCPMCGGTGDSAHTAFYCPFQLRNGNLPLATKLKKSKRNAASIRS